MEATREEKDLFLTKMEFNMKLSCESCAEIVRSKLVGVAGIQDVSIDVSEGIVLVDSVLKSSEVQALLESTGFLVFFKGFGGTSSVEQSAAVAILKGPGEQMGLLRMVQTSNCIIEVTLDKMSPGEYAINIHEFGDISKGADSCGEVYHISDEIPPAGNLGRVCVDTTGIVTLHLASEKLNVSSVLGRSVVVSFLETREWLMCGVIARSAGLFQNPKRLCTCDGVSIWDEAQRHKQL